ncbi:hypothetical protein lerEdw1_009531 [Lerista edwardsae]|nr:hypothetical protein lerEdw1_009531 [Lerista edwardsae]
MAHLSAGGCAKAGEAEPTADSPRPEEESQPLLHGAGICKWFNVRMGFGFLAMTAKEGVALEAPVDVFVHQVGAGRAGLGRPRGLGISAANARGGPAAPPGLSPGSSAAACRERINPPSGRPPASPGPREPARRGADPGQRAFERSETLSAGARPCGEGAAADGSPVAIRDAEATRLPGIAAARLPVPS